MPTSSPEQNSSPAIYLPPSIYMVEFKTKEFIMDSSNPYPEEENLY